MKRILLLGLLLTFQLAWGQNVRIIGEQCPGCAVYVEGRHLQPSDHKAGCWWLAQQQQAQSSSQSSGSSWGNEPYSDSSFFGNIEGKPLSNDEYYELLLRTHCDYCGADFSNQHKSDCIIGKTYSMWQKTMRSGKEWDAIQLRDNIVTLMLNTQSGKNKLHTMRDQATPAYDTDPKPSTQLRDYTPAPEKPVISVSAPLIPCPLAQPAPQFSGINEQSLVFEKIQTTAGKHEWGEMADGHGPIEYDLERHTHVDGGPVVLGKRNKDGSKQWYILRRDESGKYVGRNVYDRHHGGSPRDVRFEGEGQFLVAEYDGGYKVYYEAATDTLITDGTDVSIAPMMKNGRFLVLAIQDPEVFLSGQVLYDGPGNLISGEKLFLFDDAIVERSHDGSSRLLNWDWDALSLEGTQFFKDIYCFRSDKGSYYVVKIDERKFALVGRGFCRVGGLYSSANEALLAWSKQ